MPLSPTLARLSRPAVFGIALAALGLGTVGCPKAPVASADKASRTGVSLERVTFDADSGTLYVEAAFAPGAMKDRADPVYMGVTAVTPDGTEIDLMVNELFPGALDAPVVFYAEIGAPVRDLLIGVWDHKVEPCSVDRSGCKQFGFVLDGPLASWPPGLYDEGVRQRIPPATVRMKVYGVGSGVRAARDALTKAIAPFGSTVSSVVGSETGGAVHVGYADAHDLYLARSVAAAIHAESGVDVPVIHEPISDAEFAVVLPE